MAAAAKSGASGICWMNGGEGGEGKTRTPFGLRSGRASSKRGTTMRARRSSDCNNEARPKKQGHFGSEPSGKHTKEPVWVRHSAAAVSEHAPSARGTLLPSAQVISAASSAKSQVCLKDLCPEDKRRIANLIEELARVSEEKEESVQRLKHEQEHFECNIQKLEQQNLIIGRERESLQQQYIECQELLGLYQQYLSQQKAKLNQSISQLSQAPAHSRVLSSEEAPSRSSPLDGSYLDLAAERAPRPQGGGGREAAPAQSHRAPLACEGEFSPTDGPTTQQRTHKRECRESHRRWKHGPGSGLENGHHDALKQLECESGMPNGSQAHGALTRPLLGHEDWEEKRHQVLLQKMQLEMEREVLQARLAEQEERLSRQSQELHQSRLDSSRFQQAAQSELSGEPQPDHQDVPSNVCVGAEVQPAGPHTAPLEKEASEPYRKDVATSPAQTSPSPSKTTSVSVIPKTPEARLDFSLVELLDVFSPVSVTELSAPSSRRLDASQRRLVGLKPAGRAPLTPAGSHPQSRRQDLEESQILEDIFFIC
ncbi:protein hinderin isoform X2 [Cyclopterus lumpus]|uniref:protein hinderin isoform X2 n=1 Tax=Cyclopterus lumpus TaxID=8103 RepID=UPI0014869F95|nr:protein hinderin isoform X2 [Cyclopterus lumpus]